MDLGSLLLDLYMFFGPGRFFFFSGPGGAKNVGDVPVIACVFSGPCKKLDLHVFVLDLGTLTAKLIVSELGICFWEPRACFVDLASIGWGETPLF